MARTLTQNSRRKTQNWPLWLLAVGAAALAGLAPPIVTAALVVGLLLVGLLLRNPVWGAYALVLSVPVQKAVTLAAGITVTQALFALVLGIWFAWLSLRRNRKLELTPIALAFLLFIMLGMLPSIWFTTSLPESLAEISRWSVTVLAYIIFVNSVQTRREVSWLVGSMLVAGTAEALLGLMQAYSATGPASFIVAGLLTRSYGTIGAPNSFAGYLNMSLPLALALAIWAWGRWYGNRGRAPLSERPMHMSWQHLRWPLMATGVAFILFWSVITSLSRGAWVGLTAGVLVMVLAMGKRAAGGLVALGLVALVMIGLGSAGALPPVISERFDQLTTQLAVYDPRGLVPTPDNYALMERMVHWQVAGNMYLASPWTGVGIGNFNVLFNEYGVQGWPYSRGHAHNYYLHMLAETGAIGLFFYAALLITALIVGFRALGRARAREDMYAQTLVVGALGILVTLMVHNIFENLHALNMGIHWVAALALFTLVERGDGVESERKGVQNSASPSRSLLLDPKGEAWKS